MLFYLVFFAPIIAIICLIVTSTRRHKKQIELLQEQNKLLQKLKEKE